MHHPPSHSRPSIVSNSMTTSTHAASIPPTQTRALDRRHNLDEQQRTFRSTHSPHPAPSLHHRRRPPA
jgi:hypothetical protein